MVAETSVFIKGQDEQSVFPLRTVADGFIDAFDEDFTIGDWGRRVERLKATAFWVDIGELRKCSGGGVGIELLEGKNVSLRGAGGELGVLVFV